LICSAPDPRGAEQDFGHEGGRARLPGALRRHLRGRGVLGLPPLRGRHHGRRARQLRPQLRRGGRPAGAQRRGTPQLRAAPRARVPAPLLLAPGQRRRAPLPGPPVARRRHPPVPVAHRRAHGGALRSGHRHPQHLDALRVLRVYVRRHHLVDLPWRHCSQVRHCFNKKGSIILCLCRSPSREYNTPFCFFQERSRHSKAEGQGSGGNDDHFGRHHKQHRHCLKHHELNQRQNRRGQCRKHIINTSSIFLLLLTF
jgi:hypothetical protein